MESSDKKPAVVHNESKSRFEVEVGGNLAHADYLLSGDTIVMHHTWVPPELRGQGLAGPIVRAALEHARERGLKVVPQCSYVATYIKRHHEFADLVAG